jgi:drug/metabolite transporter (DMT)-like permease
MTTQTTSTSNSGKSASLVALFHLSVVYVVWGSTYLAIRIAVMPGAGFPPFALGASRFLIAGSILWLWAAASRQRVRLTRREFGTLATSGILLFLGGNGVLNWAEQRVDSGLAALIIGATPIWVAGMEAILDRRLPSALLASSLLVGFAGIALLSAPTLMGGISGDIWSMLGVLFAALSWGAGTLLLSRKPVYLSPTVSSSYQQLTGGVAVLGIALLAGEPFPQPTTSALLAWGFLVIFGSILAFTSFVKAVQLLPMNIVMTYPFVNPVIAVLLGRLILNEPITIWTVAGAALVLLGVAGVFRTRYGGPKA